MTLQRLEHSGFLSVDAKSRRKYRFAPRRHTVYKSERNRTRQRMDNPSVRKGYAASMMAKIGVCVGACALVLVIELVGRNEDYDYVDAVGQSTDEQFDDNSLGKLQFVELPGILEVFSTSEPYEMPIEYSKIVLSDDDTRMTLLSSKNQNVIITFDGYVKDVGNVQGFGDYACVSTAEDKEITFCGFDSVTVEKGQTLRKGDSMGEVLKDAKVAVTVNENGRPANPLEHFNAQEKA